MTNPASTWLPHHAIFLECEGKTGDRSEDEVRQLLSGT